MDVVSLDKSPGLLQPCSRLLQICTCSSAHLSSHACRMDTGGFGCSIAAHFVAAYTMAVSCFVPRLASQLWPEDLEQDEV